MSAERHPLPESKEARHREIPETIKETKGQGEEGSEQVQPRRPAVNPDGEPYRYDDLGRGPETSADSASPDARIN